VCGGPTGDAAWDAFCHGSNAHGTPAHVMSDNGSCFTGRFSGGEAAFERDLRTLGVGHLLSSPAHPQTCGKLERWHQTLKKWLRQRPLARTHRELQHQLDEFVAFYNHDRPHRALNGDTPIERWSMSEPATPGSPLAAVPNASAHIVQRNNLISWSRHRIAVGPGLAGQQLLVIARGDDLAVFGSNGLIRRLTIDRSRNYQPLS
jgi:hypothetical protein